MPLRSTDTLLFTLPYKNRPGTDLMSRLVLLNADVMTFIIKELIGPSAVDQYQPHSTEWANDMQSDVLFAADDFNTFPPILLEVQSVVDDNFLHRLVLYWEEVNEEYGAVPVVRVVAINKTRDSVMRKTTKNKRHGFLFQLPSFPWAKKCLILNNDSIRDHITSTPLSPLVALGAFFIAQKQSILDHDHRHDPTIRQLYTISQHAFENVVIDENTTVDDLLCLCENTQSKSHNAIEALEDLPQFEKACHGFDE